MLHAIVVTYRRPHELRAMLRSLAVQTLVPTRIVVVDNDPVESARSIAQASDLNVEYLPVGANRGPAGGIALGLRHLLKDADDNDWVVLLDDNDPPHRDDLFELLYGFAVNTLIHRPRLAGVGASGSRFDLHRARHRRLADCELSAATPVDVLGGGQFPMYRFGAIRAVGVFDADLFFGFEELEFGLRLKAAGFELIAHGPVWLDKRRRHGSRLAGIRIGLDQPGWRRYYSLRNLIVILRRHGAVGAALRVSLVRGILKPLFNLPRSPVRALAHLRLNLRALHDGWLEHLGLTVPPGGEE